MPEAKQLPYDGKWIKIMNDHLSGIDLFQVFGCFKWIKKSSEN